MRFIFGLVSDKVLLFQLHDLVRSLLSMKCLHVEAKILKEKARNQGKVSKLQARTILFECVPKSTGHCLSLADMFKFNSTVES